jgi:hypothetical protein
MTNPSNASPGADDIILVTAEGQTWLLQGEPHAHAMLSDEGDFPTPVFCVEFPAQYALSRFLDRHGGDLTELWEINPTVKSRLQDRNALQAMFPPEGS